MACAGNLVWSENKYCDWVLNCAHEF